MFSPLILILNGFFIYFFRKWLGPLGIFFLSFITLIVTLFLTTLTLYFQLTDGSFIFFDFGRWFFLLDLIDSHLIFICDNLSLISMILVLFLALFANYFGSEYMYREAFINRLLYLLYMFVTSVIILFTVYDFFLVLIVWELIGLFSLLLVNFYATRIYTLKAALKTFFLSRISDLFIFFSFLIFIIFFNTCDFSVIFLKLPFYIFYNLYIFSWSINLLTFLATLIVLSSSVKAAQFLFHTWLPDAMEAPTPASALIHSSTLVIMGIYFIIRFSLLFELTLLPNFLLSIIGSITIAFGAITASFQNDIKKLVAYSTISQMGYLFCGCGFLCYNEVIFYLTIHALNKAFLFILVGYIVHFFSGNTDLRFMGSLFYLGFDLLFIIGFVSLNLTGLPFTSGFIAKEFLLFQTTRDEFFIWFVRFCWFISFFFTPFYMLIVNVIVFFYSKVSYRLLWQTLTFDLAKTKSIKINIFFNNSIIYSKLTGLLLLFFFLIVSLFGEYFTAILFNITSLNLVSYQHSLSLYNFNLTSSSVLFTLFLNNIIFYFVLVLAFFSTRYLFLIFF